MTQLNLAQDIRRVTVAEQQQYVDWGCVTNLPLFDAVVVEHLQQRFREFFDLLPDGVDITRLNQWHKANRWVYELSQSLAILDYVEGLIGPDFFLMASSFFCKYPGNRTGLSWHQDAQFWPLYPHRAVTV
ncbi:MAG: phytanoyl-CoA dioxygenase family protein [Lentisphaeria bacterium]|nr:phytanoyl-CoA dioxygenase family protein [Lentisphaeria bacterium]